MLIRSWNVFHGNTLPRGRRNRLEEMVRVATSDRPDVLCLQEVPLWGLPLLPRWSGMTVRHVVTRRAPLGAWIGGAVTRLNSGFFRSALSGQANAILLAPGLESLEHRLLRIDEGLRERRFCHAVRLDGLVVANLHATNDFRHPEVPGAEIARAAALLTDLAAGGPSVLAGDFNLVDPKLPGPNIDHIVVSGIPHGPLEVWPVKRRRHNGFVLSDHAPVEVTIG